MVNQTLAILKPDALTNPHILKMIIKIIGNSGLKISRSQEVRLSRMQAEKLYSVHTGKFFYERLIRHVTSGPVVAMILTSDNENAIIQWRKILGPAKAFKSLINDDDHNRTLREKFALSDARNVCHGSDSENEFQREVQVFPGLLDDKAS